MANQLVTETVAGAGIVDFTGGAQYHTGVLRICRSLGSTGAMSGTVSSATSSDGITVTFPSGNSWAFADGVYGVVEIPYALSSRSRTGLRIAKVELDAPNIGTRARWLGAANKSFVYIYDDDDAMPPDTDARFLDTTLGVNGDGSQANPWNDPVHAFANIGTYRLLCCKDTTVNLSAHLIHPANRATEATRLDIMGWPGGGSVTFDVGTNDSTVIGEHNEGGGNHIYYYKVNARNSYHASLGAIGIALGGVTETGFVDCDVDQIHGQDNEGGIFIHDIESMYMHDCDIGPDIYATSNPTGNDQFGVFGYGGVNVIMSNCRTAANEGSVHQKVPSALNGGYWQMFNCDSYARPGKTGVSDGHVFMDDANVIGTPVSSFRAWNCLFRDYGIAFRDIASVSQPALAIEGCLGVDCGLVQSVSPRTDMTVRGNISTDPVWSAAGIDRNSSQTTTPSTGKNCYWPASHIWSQAFEYGPTQSQTLAGFQSVEPTLEIGSVNENPTFANAAGGDYTVTGPAALLNSWGGRNMGLVEPDNVGLVVAAAPSGPTYSNPSNPVVTITEGGSGTFDLDTMVATSNGAVTYTALAPTVAGITLAGTRSKDLTVSASTAAGTYNFTATGTDADGGTTTPTMQVVVNAALTAPTWDSTPNPADGTEGVNHAGYDFTANSTSTEANTTYTTLGTWPAGLTLAANGTLSGQPTTAGTYSNLQVRLTDDGGTADSAVFDIVIAAASAGADVTSNAVPLLGGTAVRVEGTTTQAGSGVMYFAARAGSTLFANGAEIKAHESVQSVANPTANESRTFGGFSNNTLLTHGVYHELP